MVKETGASPVPHDRAKLTIDGLEDSVKAGADTEPMMVYAGTKFIHLLGAHHWRRQLGDKATVVAVSPGMIPGTNLSRHHKQQAMNTEHPDAKPLGTGMPSRSLGGR